MTIESDRRTSKSWWRLMIGPAVGVLCLSWLWANLPEPKPYGWDHPNRVLTADVLLKTLDAKTEFSERAFRPTFLPKTELEIVEKELRSRYPFQSLRKRLHFQASHPKPVARIEKFIGTRNYEDGFFSRRARALAELHSDKVHDFINRAGQGMMRMPPPEPIDLPLWDGYTNRLASEPVDSRLLGEAIVPLEGPALADEGWWPENYKLADSGLPKKDVVQSFHRRIENDFARADTLGYVENVDQTTGFQSHRVRFPKDWDGDLRTDRSTDSLASDIRWKVNRMHLVSLLMHDEPLVYETDELPNMEELSSSDAPTRRLSEFESSGLDELKRGKDLVTKATANRIIMLGAVRAGKSCLECHAVEADELLGAFSYELLRKPELDLSNASQKPKPF